MLKYTKIFLTLLTVTFFGTSCLDNKVEQQEEDALKKLQDYKSANGFTEDENIGYGIYLKIHEEGAADGVKPLSGNMVNVTYDGKYTDNTVFETTDYESAEGQYKDAYIYGPKRLRVGELIFGIDTAIKFMNVGTKAEILIPHQYAFGNYEPVVYTMEVLDVITNDSLYESNEFKQFRTAYGFEDDNAISTGLYYKLQEGDTLLTEPVLSANDSVQILLESRYAEDYYDDHSGRLFYPRVHEYDTIVYRWETTSIYPIKPAIDSALKYMHVGQTLEIACESGAEASVAWGYGTSGVRDLDFNFYLVPGYTSLHYKITLLWSNAE